MRQTMNLVKSLSVAALLSCAAVPAQASPAVQSFVVESQVYSISKNQSQALNLSRPISRAIVANPEVAEISVISATEILVTGKMVCETKIMVKYRKGKPQNDLIAIQVTPDQVRMREISKTVTSLLSKLNPGGTVSFELRPVWLDKGSAIQRQVDEVGNQIDGNRDLKDSARKDQTILQSSQTVGASRMTALAGDYLVLLTGTINSGAEKKRINSVISALGFSVINMIDVDGPQEVKLSVRIAEVVKGNPFRSGAVFGNKYNRSGVFAPGSSGGFLMELATASGNLADTSNISVPFANDAFQIGINPPGSNLFGVLSVMEGNNLARVLAKPELVVQSGETAEFLVGGEVPIPVSQNADSVTVEYKEFGVRLRFSPIITESGKIKMTVAPEVSNIDESAGTSTSSIQIPGFRSRKAQTTVTLEPGQSFVIGGLLQDNLRNSISKIPVLGDIPLLGALFRSVSYEKDQTELAILVSPTFVQPIDDIESVRLPGESMTRPTVSDGILFGKLVKTLPEGQKILPELSERIGLEAP